MTFYSGVSMKYQGFSTSKKIFDCKYFITRIGPHSRDETPGFFEFLPVLDVKIKRGLNVLWSFFKIYPCSAISFQRSPRELSIYVAEHMSTYENKEVVRILVIFQDISMFSHIILKVSAITSHLCG